MANLKRLGPAMLYSLLPFKLSIGAERQMTTPLFIKIVFPMVTGSQHRRFGAMCAVEMATSFDDDSDLVHSALVPRALPPILHA